jgi:hypothetical protein
MASTVFGAVAKAKEFFQLDFWKGPEPTPETIYRVHLVADERVFQVPASAVERWKSRVVGKNRAPRVEIEGPGRRNMTSLLNSSESVSVFFLFPV